MVVAALVEAVNRATRRGLAAWASIAGALAAVLVMFAGFAITERIIACGPGVVSGGGSGVHLSERQGDRHVRPLRVRTVRTNP
jgi:hypothetical protein